MALSITESDLRGAWERVQENEGCAGSDGVTVHRFAHRLAKELPRLLQEVESGRYRPFPLLKIVIEKRPGSAKMRTLLVPTVRDRILQTAVARQLSRSFEEEFLECSYGYRPGRSVDRAIARIRKCHQLGYRFVVDADIETYFDRVDQDLLLHRLAERQIEELTMDLLRLWVRAELWDGARIRRLWRGVPQGSPISPLLANFFLEDFDRELEKSGRKLVRYADDFLILAQTHEGAAEALEQTKTLLAAAHLRLNVEKTHIVDFDQGFRFLGALFQGDSTWVPWKHDHRRGRLLFMAHPMPARLRHRYTLPPPRSSMELALEKAHLTVLPKEMQSPPKPRRNEVAFLYLTEQGSVLRKAGDRFLIEKDDEVLLDLPYHKLETVLLFGNIQITTQAMAELLEKGVHLSLFSRQGHYRGSLAPPRGKNVRLRVQQFEAYEDSSRALSIAQAAIEAKVANAITVLKKCRPRPDTTETEARAQAITRLEQSAEAVLHATDIATLDGVEGSAARTYFDAVMLFNRSEMTWPGRQKHPAPDPLNALLSLTYTMLTHELTGLLEGVGLDPYLGFLHQLDYGRPSLALDLVEPFRHPVADRFVLNLANRKVIDPGDFQGREGQAGVFLTHTALQRYFGFWERWMLARPAAKDGEKPKKCFRDCLKDDVEALVEAIRAGGPFRPYHFADSGVGEEDNECSTSSVTI